MIERTYAEWYEFLEKIACSSYWEKIPAIDRCVHILRPEENSPAKSQSERKGSIKTEVYVNKHRKLKGRKSDKFKQSMVMSSDDSSSEESYSESSESFTSTSSYDNKSRYKSRRNKDVVTPPHFRLDGKVTLKQFLITFENYFKKKFDGSSFDQTQELGQFLSGKLLDVYNIKGGRKMKYRRMKEELLSWYRKQKVGGKSFWKMEFQKASPEPGETFDLYGMRLLEIFQSAYPHSKTEFSKELKTHFLNFCGF